MIKKGVQKIVFIVLLVLCLAALIFLMSFMGTRIAGYALVPFLGLCAVMFFWGALIAFQKLSWQNFFRGLSVVAIVVVAISTFMNYALHQRGIDINLCGIKITDRYMSGPFSFVEYTFYPDMPFETIKLGTVAIWGASIELTYDRSKDTFVAGSFMGLYLSKAQTDFDNMKNYLSLRNHLFKTIKQYIPERSVLITRAVQ